MSLEKHLLKNKDLGVYFGDYSRVHRWDFEWYFSDANIGITNYPSCEGESFIDGFLGQDDRLILIPSEDYPMIHRESDPKFAKMRGRDSGIEEIKRLIRLIQSHDVVHAYLASHKRDGSYPMILTFSPQAPPRELYKLGKPMPVLVKPT